MGENTEGKKKHKDSSKIRKRNKKRKQLKVEIFSLPFRTNDIKEGNPEAFGISLSRNSLNFPSNSICFKSFIISIIIFFFIFAFCFEGKKPTNINHWIIHLFTRIAMYEFYHVWLAYQVLFLFGKLWKRFFFQKLGKLEKKRYKQT